MATSSVGDGLNSMTGDRLNPMVGDGFTARDMGVASGSTQTTPQKGPPVVTDPVELFRLRCLREAEEKFRVGMAKMFGEEASQASFVSVGGEPEPFVPKPPPGPPPPSPPRNDQLGTLGYGINPPTQPPLPPFPNSVDCQLARVRAGYPEVF